MKKLAMSAFFVMVLFGSAMAQNSALSLYTDATISICNSDIASFETDTIRMYYVRADGPNLGNAVEFSLKAMTPTGGDFADAIFLGTEWSSQITVTLGDILNGISLTGSQCLGANEAVVYIGAIYVMYTGFSAETFIVMTMEHPGTQPPAINITECIPGNPIRAIKHGWFVFNGSCSTGVKETSWGAIKELYR